MFFGRKSDQIGLSIGSSSIKIAELKKKGKSYSLSHFGFAPLPDGAIVNREIMNPKVVVDTLKGLVDQLKIKGKSVVASLSGASVIVKRIQIDSVPKNELEDALLFEVEQFVPFDLQEVLFDYQILNDSGQKMDALLVAVKKALYESYYRIMEEAGLKPSIVNVDLLAMADVFEMNYPETRDVLAFVDIGAASTKISVYQNQQPVFTRDTAMGGRDLTQEISKQLNVSWDEAEILKTDGDATGQYPQEVIDLIHESSQQIAHELKRSIDFFMASQQGLSLSGMYISGGGAKVPQISEIIEGVTNIPVQILDPFLNISADTKIFSDQYLQTIKSIAVIPMGLALRGY